MSKFKTVQIEESKLKSFNGELKILAQQDGLKQKVELWLLNDITNNNDWRYERLDEHRKLFAETPILVAYVRGKVGDGHNFEEIQNPDGSITASFMSSTAERIVGFFKDENDIRIEERDGKKWVVGVGWIWQWYAQELVEKLKRQGLEGMSVSIETLVNEGYMDGTTEVFTKYQILGTTILGDDVKPAVTDANIRALSALGIDEIKKQTLRVASKYEEQKTNPQKILKEKKVTMKPKDLKNNFKGFKVLAVEGEKVALLSADKGEAFVSTVVKDNGEIIEGVKNAVNATVVFGEGENEMRIALDAITEAQNAEIAELTAQLKDCQESKEAIEKSLKAMQDAEKARRRAAVKQAIKEQLEKNRANNDADIAENECDDLMTDEMVEKYSEMEDDGKFIGEDKARNDVDSRCMAKIREFNEHKANQLKKTYAWEIAKGEKKCNEATDDVQSLIEKFGK